MTQNDARQTRLPQKDVEALVAQLPSRPVIEALVEFFFDEANWHYFLLERFYFESLLSRWPPTEGMKATSYLTTAEMSMEMRYFPALLFQVLALSLQFVPAEGDIWAQIPVTRVSGPWTYSELGNELLSVLGRPGLALTAVQSDFLRASWLENCGKGIQSWHTFGAALRFVRSHRYRIQSSLEIELIRRHRSIGRPRSLGSTNTEK